MKQTITFLFLIAITTFNSLKLYSQVTTITTGLPNAPSSLGATAACITFTIANNNSYPMVLKGMDFYMTSTQNGMIFNLRYSSTSLSGQTSPTVSTWPIIATVTFGTVSTLAIHPLFTNLNFTIPANTTYRFAVQHSGGSLNYGGATTTPNSYTQNGVTLGRGSYQIAGQNVGYSGSSGSTLAFNPRFWCGTVYLEPGAANNVSAITLITPTNNSQLCYNSGTTAKVRLKNSGSLAQSNFPVVAAYSGPVSGTLSGTYLGTLAPGAIDSVDLGPLNLPAGNYSMKAYTQLAADSIKTDDTSGTSLFMIKAPVLAPSTISDTVCLGNSAFISVDSQPNITYNWYSQANGGTVVNTGNALTFPSLTQDTLMYVSGFVNGCASGRTPISAVVGPPPTLELGMDTSFCESVPLVLDAGNPGGTYMWSTGDSTQTITVTNISGKYWVLVDKYCTISDTVNVTISPVPEVTGISYVRMNNTYSFNASSAQFVDDYVWHFGDGVTLAGTPPAGTQLITAVHTYLYSIKEALDVKLVINNECGTDTVLRTVPTGINNVSGSDDGIRVYPNPATDKLNIFSGDRKVDELQILDLQGKVLNKKQVTGNTNALDMIHLSSGLYILRLRSDEGTINRLIEVIK